MIQGSPEMRGPILTYEPGDGQRYFPQRNREYAKMTGRLTMRSYGGEFNPDTQEIPDDVFWFLHGPISPDEAAMLGMKTDDRNFFGGVMPLLHAQKSVFHLPVPGAEHVPDDFPYAFVKSVEQTDTFLPGYTAFTPRDAHKAYD